MRNTWTCSCNLRYEDHLTVFETRKERIENGRATTEVEQILNEGLGYGKVAGELTAFMDLADDAEKFGSHIAQLALDNRSIQQTATRVSSKPGLRQAQAQEESLEQLIKQQGAPKSTTALELFNKKHRYSK